MNYQLILLSYDEPAKQKGILQFSLEAISELQSQTPTSKEGILYLGAKTTWQLATNCQKLFSTNLKQFYCCPFLFEIIHC
jgi:hypothetical protein